jgi:hypothetical protein
VNALSLRERAGVRGDKKGKTFKFPLILTFSLKGEGTYMCLT